MKVLVAAAALLIGGSMLSSRADAHSALSRTAPKRIVQRDGEIFGVQARNFILPEDDLVVIVFTNRSADDFTFGEVWEGKGFAYDLLSAAVAC